MPVATRPRSVTAHSIFSVSSISTSTPSTEQVHSPRFTHFRPARYQTKEDLDRFFGTTRVQKREQRLRVREEDGQVFFDWIEKQEWQHLLATGCLTSPSTPAGNGWERRRSSVATCLTLNSPLYPASPGRRTSVTSPTRSASMSPLTMRFGHVGFDAYTETHAGVAPLEGYERRGRKRSNSALAATNGCVEDPFRNNAEAAKNWITASGFKRRQSETFILTVQSDDCEQEEQQHTVQGTAKHDDRDLIRISRLPLRHRKLDQQTLDQAFGTHVSRHDLSTKEDHLQPSIRSPKPLALQLPSRVHVSDSIEIEDEHATSSTCSSPVRSPTVLMEGTTFDSFNSVRRGTFGSLFPAPQQQEQHAVQALKIACDTMQSDTTTPSSVTMEVLKSPTTSHSATCTSQPLPAPAHGLRHARSLQIHSQRRSCLAENTVDISTQFRPPVSWTQRQRWHSEGDEPSYCANNALQPGEERKLRAVRSIASLSDSHSPLLGHLTEPAGSAVKMESDRTGANKSRGCLGDCSDLDTVWTTPLAPRTGAKKFDRTRIQHLTCFPSPAPTSCTSSPPKPTEAAEAIEPIHHGVGLRTGPEVYHGIDIPCASIYLHSDPEDNVEPALAQSMSATKLKKLKKKLNAVHHSASSDCPSFTQPKHARYTSVVSTSAQLASHSTPNAKTASRWWNHILHN